MILKFVGITIAFVLAAPTEVFSQTGIAEFESRYRRYSGDVLMPVKVVDNLHVYRAYQGIIDKLALAVNRNGIVHQAMFYADGNPIRSNESLTVFSGLAKAMDSRIGKDDAQQILRAITKSANSSGRGSLRFGRCNFKCDLSKDGYMLSIHY